MPKTTDWRTQGASDALKDLDRSDLAWEFLRRNPDYQEDYRKALQLSENHRTRFDPAVARDRVAALSAATPVAPAPLGEGQRQADPARGR